MEAKYKEANATFKYTIGQFQGEKLVRSRSLLSRSRDDWKVNLAVQAASEISKINNIELKDLSLKLQYFEVRV